jgi:short-subunit dehydrogenase
MGQPPFFEKAVVLTGASSGIGRELACQLADQGAWLALAGRNLERLQAVEAECRQRGQSAGSRSLVVQTDVADETQCRRLIALAVNQFGRIDTLINNAGLTMWARFDAIRDMEPLETIMQVNYFGSVYCTSAALPYLKRSLGQIVVVSSLSGKTGVPLRSGYAASKHALVGFFDSLRIELEDEGVSVTIVSPDFVATETRERAFGADGKPLGKSPVQEGKVMPADTCARLILKAAAGRRREAILSRRGKIGQWIKLAAPGLIDRIARRAVARGK